MQLILMALMCLGLTNRYNSPVNTVDRIEFSKHYNRKLVEKIVGLKRVFEIQDEYLFTQCILWDWDVEYNRYNAITFFLIEENNGMLNYDLLKQGDYYNLIIKRDSIETFLIRSKIVSYTEYVDFDPEKENKKIFNEKYRRRILNTDHKPN